MLLLFPWFREARPVQGPERHFHTPNLLAQRLPRRFSRVTPVPLQQAAR
jgi:hypothetical protein